MRIDTQLRTYNLSDVEVVVVDDCPIMLDLLRVMLNSMNIRKVHCTTDADRALEDVATYRPHLVITDLLMGLIDGLSLASVIRHSRDNELRCTPIFVLTGFTDRKHVLMARDAGVHEVLAKPVSVTTIYRRICNLIERPPKFIETATYFGPDRQFLQESFAVSDPQATLAVEEDDQFLYIDVD